MVPIAIPLGDGLETAGFPSDRLNGLLSDGSTAQALGGNVPPKSAIGMLACRAAFKVLQY